MIETEVLLIFDFFAGQPYRYLGMTNILYHDLSLTI